MNNLADKIIVFFGGYGGIGFPICKYAHGKGAKIVIVGRNPERLAEAKKELGFKNVIAIQADATNAEDVNKVFKETTEEFGEIDQIWISIGENGSWEQNFENDDPIKLESSRSKHHPSLVLPVEVITPVAEKLLREQGYGILVHMSSHVVERGEDELPGNHVYRELKTKADEIVAKTNSALKGTGATAVNLRPGIIYTLANAALLDTEDKRNAAVSPEDMLLWVTENMRDPDLAPSKLFNSSVVV